LVNYDPVNRILFRQWNDNKGVSFISSPGVSGNVTANRRVGSRQIDWQIKEALKRYTPDNFMGGFDNVNKDKTIGGAFTKKGLLKNWSRMGLLVLFDFMVENR
jgi:hypothetical protein